MSTKQTTEDQESSEQERSKASWIVIITFFGSWEPPDGIAVKLVGLVAIKERADISRLHK